MIPEKIKYGVLTKAKNAEVHEIDMQVLGDDDVLIKQQACNICTTDYGQWLGLREHQGYPMAGGHESSGIVAKIGANVKDFKEGDRVSFVYAYCGKCEYCKVGRTDMCVERKNFNYIKGIKGDFGFANYFIRNSKYLVKMAKDVDPSEAGFIEPIATVISAQKNVKFNLGDTCIVIGAGTMGLVNAQIARLHGVRVIVSEVMDNKLQKAKEMGFEVIDAKVCNPIEKVMELTDKKGADLVILAVGATIANDQALQMVKEKEGQILYFSASFPPPAVNIDSNIIHYRRLRLIGAFEAYMEDFMVASKILSNKLIDVSPLIEKKFKLDDIQSAFQYASEPGRYRVSLILE